MPDLALPPPVPCGSCPYRQDVPSGVWAADHYELLPLYDGPTYQQKHELFMCHQQDGHLCGGWLACHGRQELLAIRLGLSLGVVHPSVLDYGTTIPLWGSGAEACEHGLRDIDAPGPEASRMIENLARKQRLKGRG